MCFVCGYRYYCFRNFISALSKYEYNNNNILYIQYSYNISHFGVASKINKEITTILCNKIKVKSVNPKLLS